MAALQVVLGQPGLESERQAHRAVINVELLNHELSGKPIILEGLFVGGSAGQAEGKLMQVRCPCAVAVNPNPAHLWQQLARGMGGGALALALKSN